MLKSEFTELTKQYVTESHYAEIEKRYYECNVDKATFCKWFKANKNGMAEAAARDAGVNEAIAYDKAVKELETKYKELNRNYDKMYEKLGNRAKELYEANVKLTEKLNAEYEKVAQAEATVKAKEQEIIELKAKLYDLMNK